MMSATTLFQIECDGEGCTKSVRGANTELVEEARERGFVAENIRDFVHERIRAKAYQVGWSTCRGPAGRDFCPDCLKRGNTRGADMIRKGAGRRRKGQVE